MDLEKAIQKSKEAAQLISHIPKSFSTKASSLLGVGIGISPGSSKEYQLVFQLNSEAERDLVKDFYPELGIQEQPYIEITGKAFSFSFSSNANERDINRCRPLQIGAHISPLNNAIADGTIGCFVRKKNDLNALFLLSCGHVLAPQNRDCSSNSIVQPGGSNSLDDIVAVLDNSPDNIDDALDAAIAKIVCEQTLTRIRNFHEPVSLLGDYAEKELPPLLKRKVFKIGSNTGMTSGWITSLNLNRNLWYGDRMMFCRHQNLISIDSEDPNNSNDSSSANLFSSPGDSGSLVYDEDGYAVGLLIGGTESGLTYALPIEPILNRLGIELILS